MSISDRDYGCVHFWEWEVVRCTFHFHAGKDSYPWQRRIRLLDDGEAVNYRVLPEKPQGRIFYISLISDTDPRFPKNITR